MNFNEYLEEHFDFSDSSFGSQLKLKGECPFCNVYRDDLRVYINRKTGKGFCHHCSTGFGPTKFVAAHAGVSWEQAEAILVGDGEPFVKAKRPEPDRIYYTNQRVVVPIFDLEGSPVAWQGRDITDKAKNKYLFPSNFKGAEYVFSTFSRNGKINISRRLNTSPE